MSRPPLENETMTTTSVQFGPEIETLRKLAATEGTSVAAIVRRIVRQALKQPQSGRAKKPI